jgi:arabinogalactan endo-1,4-beta-galactosidase
MLWRVRTLRTLVIPAAVLLVGASAAAAGAAVTQPSAPFDPSPINGDTYYLIDQATGLQANSATSAAGDDVVQSPRSFSALSQRWGMTKAPSGNWKISNTGTGLCLDSVTAAGAPTRTVQAKCAVNAPTQEWSFTYVTNGYYTVTNVATHLVLDAASSAAGAKLIQSPLLGSATQSQLWSLRASYWRGNDSSLQGKAEFDRVARNLTTAPWWHDGYLPAQDLLQIFKNQGFNMIRVRPASINTTVIYDGVTFPITTAPYNNYTLAAPPASQIIPATANSASPGGTSSGNHAQTDWSAIDIAKRAKELGMSVNVTLFYSGDNTSETPGNWAGKTVDQLAGVPPNAGLMYTYVKQEMELFRANGAWPDLVSFGNEVNGGMFNTTGAGGLSPSGTNCNPTSTSGGTGTANCFPRIQRAAMQAVVDAASDTSNPALLGAPLPPPLTCIHIDGNPDLQTFFAGATQTNGIPLDVACESYYPGWHGPLTQTQQTWHPCNAVSCGSTVQHIAENDFATEANGLGLPIFTIEDGVSYTTAGSPQDQWYGVNPPAPSRNLSRQGMIDLNKVQKNIPHNLSLGMEWWAGEATSIAGISSLQGFWATPGIGVFDASTTAGSALDNAALPVMPAMGGKLDPTLSYRLVNAANGRVLETGGASTAPGAALGTAADTGITGPQQQWQILAQGADPSQNATTYPTPMDHRGDGFFQIVNQNRTNGLNVLDANGSTASDTPVVQNPQSAGIFAITGTNANQEWDIMAAGNCGDVPANCTAPPQVSNGDGDYYVIVNKATGKVLSTSGSGTDAGIVQQTPGAPSNGDWMEPANKGQLWRIVAANITQPTIATTTSLVTSGSPSELGHPVTFTATIAGGSPVAGSTVAFKDGGTVVGTVTLTAGQTIAAFTTSALAAGSHTITAEFSGDAINMAGASAAVVQIVRVTDSHDAPVGGTVPATLALTLGTPASFGAFTPGVDRIYDASMSADVVSTAGDATLSVSDPGHLANGAFTLPQPLQVLGLPKVYAAPVSHDAVTIGFRQAIGATDALRTGTYSKTLVFTLSTTTP